MTLHHNSGMDTEENLEMFTRVTVVSNAGQWDLSVPARQPVTELCAQLSDIVSPNDDTISLLRLGGPPLDGAASLDEHGVGHGDMLYAVPSGQAPAPAVHRDEVESTEHATRARHRNAASRSPGWLGSVLLGGAPVAVVAAHGTMTPAWPLPTFVLAATMTAVTVGVRLRAHRVAILAWSAQPAWLLVGAAFATIGSIPAASVGPIRTMTGAAATGTVGAGLALALAAQPSRVGIATTAVLLATAIGGGTTTLPGITVGAAGVLVSALVAVAIPWTSRWAMSLTGVLSAGPNGPPPSGGSDSHGAAREVHAGLLLAATPVIAGGLTAAVLDPAITGYWGVAAATTVAMLVGLRARRFLLSTDRVPLIAAAGAGGLTALVGTLLRLPPGLDTVAASILAMTTIIAGSMSLLARPDLVRRPGGPKDSVWAQRLETLAAVALVPAVLGCCGLYGLVGALANR